MKKTLTLILFILLLTFGYITLDAGTAKMLIHFMDPNHDQDAIYFVSKETSLIAQILQTRQTQTQSQSRPRTQTQTQTQTQTYYIGFPMQLKWKFRTSGPVIAQPHVDTKFVYVASKPGVIYKVNQSDNKQVWRRNIGETIEEGFLLKAGILYYGTQNGRIGALETSKGQDLWTQNLAGESFLSQPGLDDKNIYWVGRRGTIVALNRTNGKFLWKFNAQAPCETSPFVTNKRIFFGCDNHLLFALDRTAGFVQWKFYAGAEIKGSPIAADEVVYFGSEDTYFYALKEENGTVLWKYKSGGAIRGVPMFYEDQDDMKIKEVLFASFDNFLYNVRIKNGSRKWLSATNTRVYNRMHFDRALIFLAPFGGYLQGYDPHTGERVGEFNTQNRIRSSPMTSQDLLFVGLNNGNLLCLTRTPPPPPESEEGTTTTATQTTATMEEEEEEEQTQTQTQTQTQVQTQSQTGTVD